MSDEIGYRVVHLPEAGALRVHPDPSHLPRLRLGEPGRNRFDDPERAFAVRYAAETLRGCLIETMARFRPDLPTDLLLGQVEGIEPEDVEHLDPTAEIGDWLAQQRVGTIRPDHGAPVLLDVEDANFLLALNKHPRVREALDASGLGTRLSPVHLDAALVRLGGPVGRPITQALARAARDWMRCDGLAYWSRLDSTERCWALWDDTPVIVETEPLDPTNHEHRSAVRSVANSFEIMLPSNWA